MIEGECRRAGGGLLCQTHRGYWARSRERCEVADNLGPVTPEEEIGAKAMVDLRVEGEIGEVPGLEPVIYGGVDQFGVSQLSIRVPPGSPVSVRRLWLQVGEAVARECVRVGIPVEGGTVEAFRGLLENREEPQE